MTFREWNAVIMLVGQVVIAWWLVSQGIAGPVAAAATAIMWAIGAMIAFNIVATIVVTILVSIVQREVLKDEGADERDRLVAAKSMRNAYVVASLGAAGSILMLALGVDPTAAAYGLFGGLMLAGATDSVSQLVYYRIG